MNMADKNGTSKPLSDVGGESFVSPADDVQLIGDSHMMTDSPVSVQRTEISPLQMETTEELRSKKKTQEGLKIIIISSVTFALSVTLALILTIVFGPPAVPPHGAVSCDSQVCSDMGLGILKLGGSAVDAAITSLLCLGVVSPHHSGIGGGFFMLIRQHAANTSTVIDARETAPGGATENLYANPSDLKMGVLSVAVPGSLRGMELAHSQYGKLSWEDIVKPVASLARHGFPVSKSLALAIKKDIDSASPLDDALVKLFYVDGQPAQEDDILQMAGLASVLDSIAEEGADAFFSGRFAEEIINATSGALTADDLANYKAIQRETLKYSFLNETIETMPAPGGGPLMLFMLSVLQNYTLAKSNQSDPLFYHRLIEIMKFMCGERYRFGDPEFVDTIDNDTELITSSEYAGMIRSLISDDKVHGTEYYMQQGGSSMEGGTDHVSVIDPDETLVSVTSTINLYFGSHVVTSSGIILNNEMYDFDPPKTGGKQQATVNNNLEPGKRPLSSMTPTIVHQYSKPCAARISLGGVNGSRIISGVLEVLLNDVVFGKSIASSIEEKRIFGALQPDQVEYEDGFSEKILTFLKNLGHKNFVEDPRGINYVHGVSKINETIMAHADSRVDGSGASIY